MIAAVMPVRDQPELTRAACARLGDDPDLERVFVLDNGSGQATRDVLAAWQWGTPRPQRLVVEASGASIYEMWDRGFRLAAGLGTDCVVILNNDVDWLPGTFRLLRDALSAGAAVAYPDYDRRVASGIAETPARRTTHGTYRHGGMSGWLFALDPAKVTWAPLVDPCFEWWYGDDDLALTVEEHGGIQERLVGVPVDHLGEGTARHHPSLEAAKGRDFDRFRTKWGDR